MSVAQGLLSHNLSLASVQNPSNRPNTERQVLYAGPPPSNVFMWCRVPTGTPYLITSLSALVGVTGRTDYKKLVYITANKQSLERPAAGGVFFFAKCGISLHSFSKTVLCLPGEGHDRVFIVKQTFLLRRLQA